MSLAPGPGGPEESADGFMAGGNEKDVQSQTAFAAQLGRMQSHVNVGYTTQSVRLKSRGIK